MGPGCRAASARSLPAPDTARTRMLLLPSLSQQSRTRSTAPVGARGSPPRRRWSARSSPRHWERLSRSRVSSRFRGGTPMVPIRNHSPSRSRPLGRGPTLSSTCSSWRSSPWNDPQPPGAPRPRVSRSKVATDGSFCVKFSWASRARPRASQPFWASWHHSSIRLKRPATLVQAREPSPSCQRQT